MEKIKVCIVEDNVDLREIIQTIINASENCECIGVMRNAKEAIELLPQLQPDIVMMDINLGRGENGIDCVRKLAPDMENTSFMICTVYDDEDSVFEALTAGATSYMLKRTPPAKMIECITELYNGGAPMSSSIARKVLQSFSTKPVNELNDLTKRQSIILSYLAKGLQYKEIGLHLDIGIETVRKHVHNIYDKLHVHSRVDAVNKYFGRNNQP